MNFNKTIFAMAMVLVSGLDATFVTDGAMPNFEFTSGKDSLKAVAAKANTAVKNPKVTAAVVIGTGLVGGATYLYNQVVRTDAAQPVVASQVVETVVSTTEAIQPVITPELEVPVAPVLEVSSTEGQGIVTTDAVQAPEGYAIKVKNGWNTLVAATKSGYNVTADYTQSGYNNVVAQVQAHPGIAIVGTAAVLATAIVCYVFSGSDDSDEDQN